MAADTRDVWVNAREQHAPAHRIPLDSLPAVDANPSAFRICCPPGVAAGGVALFRSEARDLKVHPCVRCFSIEQTDFPPVPPPQPVALQP